jgi:hypothetical protein
MFTYECRVGRLVEIRLGSPLSIRDIEEIARRARTLLFARPERMVCAVDMRELSILGPDVTEAVLASLRAASDRIERTGVLLPEGSQTLSLQIERLHREGGNPNRRTFRASSDLVRFLAEVVTLPERARLVSFFDEGLVRRRSSTTMQAVTRARIEDAEPPVSGRSRER